MKPDEWPIGEGEMVHLVRGHDWAATPLGPIEAWPQSLKTLVDLMLESDVMMSLMWGKEAIQVYNDAYAVGIGARHPRALGGSAFETWADVRAVFEPLFERAWDGETVVQRDLYLHFGHDDVPRQEAWFDLTYTRVLGERGEAAGVLAILTETTPRVLAEREQAAAEAALRESEERYRLAVEAADLGRWELVPQTGEFYTSATCNRHLGLLAYARPTHEEHFETIHPDDHEMIYQRLRRAMEGNGEFEAEYRVLHPGGGVRRILSRARVLRDRSSTPDRLIGVTLDVTETRELEEERERAHSLELTALAEVAERERISRELHDRVAHHMGVAHQSLELHAALSESAPKRAAEKLELVRETIRRALDQTRALSAELKRLQQEELAGGMEAAFEALLAESYVPDGVELDLAFSGDEASIPKPVKMQVYLAMREAVRNVLRHSDCSRTGITLRVSDGEIYGLVEDDGKGFDPEAVSRATPSWGVGLRSMRERAEMLGGSLLVASRPGAGTKVELRVPLDGGS